MRIKKILFPLAMMALLVGPSCSEKKAPHTSPLDIVPREELFNQYDISSEHPFGRLNPTAPTETQQFHFMIGKFKCQDSLLINGVWKQSGATWESSYILNGFGIKDTYRNDDYAGTSIRFFNTSKQKWEVYFFGMPGGHTGLWEGEELAEMMVMRQKRTGKHGENLESRLTFYNLDDNSFDWKGELWNLDQGTVTENWKIKARRE
ncbi:MAG: hypothetical protein KTR30_20470 [Saprospiraceae bacterium]|nr:hypothetical protein [Saprospiraceae bacterium]